MTTLRRWWCELAWLGGLGAGPDAQRGVLLETDGTGRLATVSPGVDVADAGDAAILLGLTVPGLVNAHSHAFHRALRGWSQLGPGTFWTWREAMYGLAARLQPDTYRDLAAAVFGEMVLSGITTVGEFHYLHHDTDGTPYDGDAMGEAIIAAAGDAGIRLTLLDTCYLTGGIGQPLQDVQLRFGDGSVDAWASRLEALMAAVPGRLAGPVGTGAGIRPAVERGGPGQPPALVRLGAAIHSVRAVPAGAMADVAAWAAGHQAPLHAHVSEQPAENEACVTAYGRTPTEVLAERGATGPGFTAIHATHVTGADITRLGGDRSNVCFCPTTERDLADGIGPAANLRAAGASLCLGSDSHAVIDLWEEARAMELNERLATGQRGAHPAAELLADATVRGAAALGWSDGGRLEPGALADWCTLRLDGPALAGSLNLEGVGAAAAAVFAGQAREVTDVVVAGRAVVTGGVHNTLGPIGPRLSRAIAALRPE